MRYVPRRVRGFTLVELMVTIAIVAILAGIALPNFREFTIRNNVTSTTNDLVGAINLARSEAVKRGADVTVHSASGSSDWSAGWVVEPVTPAASDPSPPHLIAHGAVDASYKVGAAATGGTADGSVITFGAMGVLKDATEYDINVCRPSYSPDATTSRRINISRSGTVKSQRDTTGSAAVSCAT